MLCTNSNGLNWAVRSFVSSAKKQDCLHVNTVGSYPVDWSMNRSGFCRNSSSGGPSRPRGSSGGMKMSPTKENINNLKRRGRVSFKCERFFRLNTERHGSRCFQAARLQRSDLCWSHCHQTRPSPRYNWQQQQCRAARPYGTVGAPSIVEASPTPW